MKLDKSTIKRLALQTGFDKYKPHCLSGDSVDDTLVAVNEYPVGEAVINFANAIAAHVCPEGYVVVPKEPTEEQWSGLARDIVMWLDMDRPTPRALFDHLHRLGVAVPGWLGVEPEMQNLDHVVSKGTRAVVIYRAMLLAAPGAELSHQKTDEAQKASDGAGSISHEFAQQVFEHWQRWRLL